MKPRLFPFIFRKKEKKDVYKNSLPKVHKQIPGRKSLDLTAELKRYECPELTFISDTFPVFLKKASGLNITDVDGNRYIDLTSSFGVASLGYTAKPLLNAMLRQAREMVHGMGDVHPNEVKVALAKRLAEITPGNLSQTIFSSTGAEAVESALKTAVMHTKKTGVIAFEGAYHGLGYGALSATHREDFRKPFEKQLGKFVYFAPFPSARLHGQKATESTLNAMKKLISKTRRSAHKVGAVLVEPIQGRGGIQVPPQNFLPELRRFCDENGIILITDEVFTGFGRTGSMFAVEKSQVTPDILCLGKGLANGFPLSACIGSARVMHSWGPSTGDAIHTSTFVGHPLGCAVALAVIKELEDKKLVERSRQMGEIFRRELYKLKEKHSLISDVRGSGLMIGLELAYVSRKNPKKPPKIEPATDKAKAFMGECLRHGVLVLLSGPDHNVISITPPFVITEKEIAFCAALFDKIFQRLA